MLERCLEWRSNRGVPNFGTMDSKILRRKVGIYQKTTGKFNHHIFNRTAKLPNSERSSSSALQSPSHGFEFFGGVFRWRKLCQSDLSDPRTAHGKPRHWNDSGIWQNPSESWANNCLQFRQFPMIVSVFFFVSLLQMSWDISKIR